MHGVFVCVSSEANERLSAAAILAASLQVWLVADTEAQVDHI